MCLTGVGALFMSGLKNESSSLAPQTESMSVCVRMVRVWECVRCVCERCTRCACGCTCVKVVRVCDEWSVQLGGACGCVWARCVCEETRGFIHEVIGVETNMHTCSADHCVLCWPPQCTILKHYFPQIVHMFTTIFGQRHWLLRVLDLQKMRLTHVAHMQASISQCCNN